MPSERHPADRELTARYAATVRWTPVTDRAAVLAPARRAFRRSFTEAVVLEQPDWSLEDIQVEAERRRRDHYRELARRRWARIDSEGASTSSADAPSLSPRAGP